MNTTFASLIAAYPTWDLLKAHLMSEEGGRLRVEDHSPYALIHYEKGYSNLTLPHVRAFRSVVWDTALNRPVSVTPFKSVDGESLPEDRVIGGSDLRVESFVDGVMLGAFWDTYTGTLRVHTRSCMDAQCRYFSQTKTFATMFHEAMVDIGPTFLKEIRPGLCYTFVLQHPENRIVVPVHAPRLYMVQCMEIDAATGNVQDRTPAQNELTIAGISSWPDLLIKMHAWNLLLKHRFQGVVVKDISTGMRWKIRTPEYNRVRKLRGNSARRDFLWLNAWRTGTLPAYLELYPEERMTAMGVVERWKRACADVYQYYIDVFKAHSVPKTAIPSKYRPLVYGLHTLYIQTLRPAGRSVTWADAVKYLNDRDTPQMLYVINWELRQAAAAVGGHAVPVAAEAAAAGGAGAAVGEH